MSGNIILPFETAKEVSCLQLHLRHFGYYRMTDSNDVRPHLLFSRRPKGSQSKLTIQLDAQVSDPGK
jgi:hypothetical protein